MKIRLAVPHIQKDSIVDGEGIRGVIWTQGCPHHCLGCHNPETHDMKGGILVDVDDLKDEIDKLEGHDGITFSGGDPMVQADVCCELARYCHQKGFSVWCYTGYTFEELLKLSKAKKKILEFLKEIDVLIDGKFILSEKSFDVIFRGSKNQRIINVSKSLKTGKTVTFRKFDKKEKNNKGRRNHHMYV
ncbi:MAG: anaerobic ribonucleoside-triphosphate reductase activating protein [Bacilli bacterium]|nr:anaerobic ribonucleoside-triphosphate reductase activating protein [Bacilli bacterium]